MFLDENLTVNGISVFRPDYEKKKNMPIPARQHHSLTFRLSGSILLETEGRTLTSCPGDLTYVPQGICYNSEICESGSMIAIHFTTAEQHGNISCEVITPSQPVIFQNLFSELEQRFKLGRENDFHCLSLFYAILAQAKREVVRTNSGSLMSPRMKKARSHIERQFSDPELTVSSLAEEAGVSEVYFRKEFNACFGTSPSAYIKTVRIENAKAYLRTGYYTVTETATRCGFDSISYFSAEFRRMVGMTPREYAFSHSGFA